MIVAEPEKQETVTHWLQRMIPFCPQCRRLMHREGQGRKNKLLRYYKCPTCDNTAKSCDRIV